MTKKHTPGYQSTKPQPVSHVSLVSRSKASSINARPDTVNDRLAQLRTSQRTNTTTTSPVQGLLSELYDSQGWTTQNIRRNGRIAGPPPPISWSDYRNSVQGLEHSQHAPGRLRGNSGSVEASTYHPPPILPDQPLPELRSLRATALRVLARTFLRQIEEKNWLVYEMTARMKCELVAVMISSAPGISSRLDEDMLQYLFGPLQDYDGTWVSGGENVTHLSLGPVIGKGIDYAQLAKNLRRICSMEREEVPDSWDDTKSTMNASEQYLEEAEAGKEDSVENPANSITQSLPKTLWIPLLPSLTHLSLARPYLPSWSSLLDIASHDCLCHLTHLDLSYWPVPSFHDLAFDRQITPLRVHNELEEIRILNRLGKFCRKLIWLGLEGCESWFSCLAATYHKPIVRPRSRFDMDQTSRKDSFIQMDWTGVWRGLEAINIVQAWIPLTLISAEVLGLAPHVPKDSTSAASFRQWWEHERKIREMEDLVVEWRLEAGLPPVKFEKSPVQPWLEVEIRAQIPEEAVIHFEPLQEEYWD